MKFDYKYYVPCLRWKQGEYQAVFQFTENIKKSFTPLIEVPEIGWDFENSREIKTIDQQIKPFAKRVFNKWGKSPCFIDMHNIDFSNIMQNGANPASFIFDELRENNCYAIPAIYLKSGNVYQKEIRSILKKDKKGVCLRISIEQSLKQTLKKDIDFLIRNLKIRLSDIHLIIDIGAPNFLPLDGFAKLIKKIISHLPNLDNWETLTILGTSFPESMGGIKQGIEILPRYEWQLYKIIINDLKKEKLRLPAFGDYAIAHPKLLQLDMRIIKPSATIRYSIDDMWCIVKGKNTRDNGFAQYSDLCKILKTKNYYSGQNFSYGDAYIQKCAEGEFGTGNLTTWRKVGTNHHIQKIILDIANFYAS